MTDPAASDRDMNSWALKIRAHRSDVIHCLVLAIFSSLIWCAVYHRWTAADWKTPLTYLAQPDQGDVVIAFATIKAARDGHIRPLLFTNIPELGAPYEANWDDFPIIEKPLICMTGILAKGIGVFAALNFAFMFEYVLAAISFYAACRMLKCGEMWAFVGAVVFAFARFPFSHGIHHLTVSYCWHIPLCMVVGLWMFEKGGIPLRGGRFLFAITVAFVAGVQNVYYTNMFCQFVLIGGLVQWWRTRDWRATLPAAGIIGVAAVAFVLMNLNTFFYHFSHGPNNGALVRAYKWLEIYGLKMVDFLIPPPDHHLPLFANFGAWHISTSVLPMGEMPPSAYLGLIGLAALLYLAARSILRVVGGARPPLETWLILWILLYSTVGGINSILGSFGFLLFRASTRYSIFVLCIVLMYAVRRLSLLKLSDASLRYVIGSLIVALALWDQTPVWVSSEDLQVIDAQVSSDRHFAEKMEAKLPANAMVFELPIMEFPESPAPGVGSYDHFRPYIYSEHLRYSFGSVKGRAREKWQLQLPALSLEQIVNRLEMYGFSAIYVNRNGFPDKGDGLKQAFNKIGRDEIIQSDNADLFCVLLKPSPQPILPDGGLYR